MAGYGTKSISKWLNGGEVRGLETLETPYPKHSTHSKSEQWNDRTVKTVLFNPTYTGHVSYQSKKNEELDRIVEKSDQIIPIRSIEKQQKIFELKEGETIEQFETRLQIESNLKKRKK